MKPFEVIKLIEKYQQGVSSAEEKLIIERWLDNLEHSGSFDLAEEDKFRKKLLMEQDLLRKIRHPQVTVKNTKKLPFRIITVAASLLLLLSIGIFAVKYYNSILGNQKPLRSVKKTISTEVNKATLVLADGQSISLQSYKNGHIATGNNLSIQKISAGKLVYHQHTGAVENNTLITPKGGTYEVVLPDGSSVFLNSSSRLIYPTAFTGDTRTVKLIGQAYFEVASNPAKPFKVIANGVNIQVYGTGFDVNAYADEPVVKATLVHGSVKVLNNKTSMMISPGQQATLNQNDNEIKITQPNLDEVLAWKKWEFRFEGADIVSILKEASRWYDFKIIYSGKISDHRFNGLLSKKASLSELLEILERTKYVHFKITDQTVTVIDGPK